MSFLKTRLITYLLLLTPLTIASDVSNTINMTEFEKCACDMTSNWCDVYCCCDQNCRPEQGEAFHCKDVKFSEETLPTWKCDSTVPSAQTGAHGLFCIMWENTPYLGLFHKNIPLIKDLPSINYVLGKKRSSSSMRKHVLKESQPKHVIHATGYVFGQEITIIRKNLQTSSLYLPYNLYSSVCDALYPVQYLNDMTSTCLLPVEEFCLSKQLDVHSFILGATDRQLLGSFGDETVLNDINVSYYMPNDPCCYVKTSECAYYGCKDKSLKAHLQTPDSPVLDKGICFNVALRIDYLFIWIGNRIKSVNLTVVVADVPAEVGHSITQYFTVKFHHAKNVSSFDNVLNDTGQDNFALKLGYKIGSPLFGLFKDSDLNEIETMLTLRNESVIQRDFLLWNNDGSGECQSTSNPLRFGFDVMSGCFYRIDDWSTLNCSHIREEIWNIQSNILIAEWISRVPSLTSESFIPVINFEDPYNITDEDMKYYSKQDMCRSVVHHVHLEIVYTEVLRTLSGPFYRIVAVKRSLIRGDWSADVDGRSSSHQITSSVKFRYISMDDWIRKQKTKRSHLPGLEPWRKREVNTWRSFLYPLMNFDLNTSQTLATTIDTTLLILIFVISAAFLWSRQSSSKR